MVGERLRQARQRQQMSLQQVAARASMSAATLSRIETNKQAVDVSTLLSLSKILQTRAGNLVEEGDPQSEREQLVQKLSVLDAETRAEIWRDLAVHQRSRATGRKSDVRQLMSQVEELLAQLDFVRAEIESVRQRLS